MEFRPKILVVEDDPAMLRLVGQVLEESGARPHLLSSSRHAAELINRDKFDGAILDWRLPEMDGLELARRIRSSKSNSRIPLVMITAVDDRKAAEESFKAGIDLFLQKPVSTRELRRLLNASRGAMLAERRRYQRAPVALAVRLAWTDRQEKGTSVNLSSTGMFVAVETAPAVGASLEAEFTLPDQLAPMRLAARVSRVTPGAAPGQTSGRGVGLEFTAATSEEKSALMDFVERTLESLGASH
jgi:DNA-binding response OmpR family regulator